MDHHASPCILLAIFVCSKRACSAVGEVLWERSSGFVWSRGATDTKRGHPAKWFSGGILQSSMDIEDFKVTNNKDHYIQSMIRWSMLISKLMNWA